ncbi:XRE family transcriptional regulator [Nocardia sp. CA-128927]|uniref:XRE family transcriptional regulator n=1 Tax=Nocardia sp. CA-128927 TaxID=3239975 RepID=UPI003D982D64
MSATPETVAARKQLVAGIAKAIRSTGEEFQDLAATTGINVAEFTQLSRERVDRYALDRLVEYCEVFGLRVTMSIHGQIEPLSERDDAFRVRAKARSAAAEHTERARLRRELIKAIANNIKASPLKQVALAEELQLSRAVVSNLQNEHADGFKLDKLVELAPKFGLSIEMSAGPASFNVR